MTFRETVPVVEEKKPKEIPELSDKQIRAVRESLPRVREDITRLLGHFDDLRSNYSEEFAEVNRKHPDLAKSIDATRELFDYLGEHNEELSNKELVQALNEYNLHVYEINRMLRIMNHEGGNGRENTLVSAVHGELPFDEAQFTAKQKQELRAFAQELWKELFPESNIDQFVQWSTGQKELEGYQKVILAPANGIESAVMGFIALFETKTYQDLVASIKTMYGLSYQDWCDLWRGLKFTYEQLPTSDKIAPVLSLICAIAFLMGGSQKIAQLAVKMKYSSETVAAIQGVFAVRAVAHVLEPVGKAAPLGTMVGISLPYIRPEEKEENQQYARNARK